MWTTSCIQDNSQTMEEEEKKYINLCVNVLCSRFSLRRNLWSRPTISYKIVGSRSNYFFNPGQKFWLEFSISCQLRNPWKRNCIGTGVITGSQLFFGLSLAPFQKICWLVNVCAGRTRIYPSTYIHHRDFKG